MPGRFRLPADLRLPLLAGLGALVAAWSIVSFVPAFFVWRRGDLIFYETWGPEITSHLLPYRDFPLEYPPGALLPFALPVYLHKIAGYYQDYDYWFRVETLGFWAVMVGAVAWALQELDGPRRWKYVALAFCGGSLLLIGPIAVSRYDAFPAMFTAVAAGALLGGRRMLACAAIGAGFVAKIYPIILLPIALIELHRVRGRRGLIEGLGVTALVALAGFVLFLVQAPHGLWSGSRRQLTRPLQVESLAASFWAVAHQFGLRVQSVKSYGSDNLTTHGAHIAATLSGIAVVVALVVVWVLFARGGGSRADIAAALAASVTAYIAFNKVFSPQYLIWLVPLVPLVGGRRGLQATGLLTVIVAMTQIWEPYHYGEYERAFPAWISVLVFVRDVLVVLLFVLLVRVLASDRDAEQVDSLRAAGV
jgi:glycosyl transferase family 87